MPDQFTEVSRQGFGSRIIGSIGGVLIGILLFIGSFVLLYWNEGRVDLSQIAETAQEINAETINSSANDKLVSVTGNLETEQKLGDDQFLKTGDYISVSRKSEMYAWEEETETSSHTDTGGSETTETTYSYTTNWTENPESSSGFKESAGHENPKKSIPSQTFTSDAAKIGEYNLDTSDLMLSGYKNLQLDDQNITLSPGFRLENDYIYIGTGTSNSPQVGDSRISYQVIEPGEKATIFGKLDDDTLVAYHDEDDNKLFRMYTGTREAAISSMETEHNVMTWILRVVGFVLMWVGLSAIFGPVSTVLDFLPFLGSASRAIIGVITFIISLVLTIITILISTVVHNVVALVIILVVVIVAITLFVVLYLNKKKGAKAASKK